MELGWGSSKFASLNPNISNISSHQAKQIPSLWLGVLHDFECFLFGSYLGSASLGERASFKIYTKMLNQ